MPCELKGTTRGVGALDFFFSAAVTVDGVGTSATGSARKAGAAPALARAAPISLLRGTAVVFFFANVRADFAILISK